MKATFIVLATVVVVAIGSALAVMNNACKSGQHAWCASGSPFRHHARSGPEGLVRPANLAAWVAMWGENDRVGMECYNFAQCLSENKLNPINHL